MDTSERALPRIVCAANRHKESGRIICGPRHWDSTMRSQIKDGENGKGWDQGFIDQFGKWYDRDESWTIANERNQIYRICYEGQNTLYSESLY